MSCDYQDVKFSAVTCYQNFDVQKVESLYPPWCWIDLVRGTDSPLAPNIQDCVTVCICFGRKIVNLAHEGQTSLVIISNRLRSLRATLLVAVLLVARLVGVNMEPCCSTFHICAVRNA